MERSSVQSTGKVCTLSLQDLPVFSDAGLRKIRILYSDRIEFLEYTDYTPANIQSLQLVQADDLDYSLKSEDRSRLEYYKSFKNGRDDVIYVRRGLVTDSSYCNLIFFDGSTWWTPDEPLLKGVRRQYLLNRGLIQERTIRVEDIDQFESVSLINAMLEPGQIQLPVSQIHKSNF
jgi:4-amino-4-deoxychorismate lyase